MSSSLIDIDITGEGPMGINLSPVNRVVSLAPGGLGDAAGVRVGDTIVRVSEASIEGKEHPEVLALIKAAGRPLRLTFSRAAPVSAARTAAATAGNLFKGFLGAAVQGIKGIDSIVGSTIDGSVRQATVRQSCLVDARDPIVLRESCTHTSFRPLRTPPGCRIIGGSQCTSNIAVRRAHKFSLLAASRCSTLCGIRKGSRIARPVCSDAGE